jgi:quercetin dioxygenase-like cupin family protein
MGVELDVGQPVLLGPGEGERLNERIVVKVERPELSVNEVNVGPDFEGPGPHFHKEHVDAFYVLEGQLEFTVGTETIVAGAGTSVAVPPGIVHAFTNPGPGGAHYLNIHAPDAGFIELLRRRMRGEEFDETEHDIYDVDEPTGPADALVAGPDGGERFERRRGVISVRVARTQLSILELDLETGWPGVGEHVHDDQVDSFFVLDGEPEFGVEGQMIPAGVGMFIAVPPGIKHEIRRMAAPARFLNVHAPDQGFADVVRRG